ncbi:MAG: VWA-like domain-containing protein [Lachnospiraceae bacterium]|nr:VWA-like domain-containing protein [Lachnospiraceae bacterium]
MKEKDRRNIPGIVQKQNEREVKKAELCHRIFQRAQTQLYMEMRYMDVPLHAFGFMPDGQIRGLGTDGKTLFFFSDWILELYRTDPVLLNRSFLHMVMHCLMGHLWSYSGLQTENPELMDLAFDITVEYMIDQLEVRCIRKNQSFLRKQLYQKLREDGHVITPGRVLAILSPDQKQSDVAAPSKSLHETGEYRQSAELQAYLQGLRSEFTVDDHHPWRHPQDPKIPLEQQKRWKEMAETMETELKLFAREAGASSKELEANLEIRNRRRYSYRSFLRKFAVLKEELKADLDSFDTIYYCYGLEHFGNVPLIEPQETSEVSKVEDFVIAVDTSMSTNGDLVKRFLEETWSILTEEGSFHRKVCVHIIQCDDQVREDRKITSSEEMEQYLKEFKVKGRGGTDFRPVFGYISQLLREKAFTHLKGMIYFTDGYGIYPALRPLYETAFVFLQEDYRDLDVPAWAVKLILTPDELLEERNE